MSSRYYVSRRPGSWLGVTEVVGERPTHYFHHQDWPVRSNVLHPFLGGSADFASCIDPHSGWWVPFMPLPMDEDLLVDAGL